MTAEAGPACVIGDQRFENTLLDLGASFNLMPYSFIRVVFVSNRFS